MRAPTVTGGPAGAAFAVRVIPRAGRTAVAGVRGDALLVRLAAPPVDGAANEALVTHLAIVLSTPRRNVELVAGHATRDKRVRVLGMHAAELSARLAALLEAA